MSPPDPAPAPPAPTLRYPDFLCIGVQKAATTWLDANLRRHPKIWLPPIKELQYFNHLYLPRERAWTEGARREKATAEIQRHMKKTPSAEWDFGYIRSLASIGAGSVDDAWYGRIFSAAPKQALCGEINPSYAMLPDDGIAHVKRLSPDLRAILILRDPIARSWSHLRMMFRKQAEIDRQALEEAAGFQDLYDRADYPAIIERWKKALPDRLLLLFMDDIESDPAAVLETVCKFLGRKYLPKRFAAAVRPVHRGQRLDMPDSIYSLLGQRLRPIYENLAQLYPKEGGRWLEQHYGS
ncbi:MAG: sulfotransferase [Alphaproteobacteria bacterium]|nr:sulfotransferase [Alphaproteobacteria bacterium]MBV9692300.1 sulfotransferase [Alphaproteobacteria bacterium]